MDLKSSQAFALSCPIYQHAILLTGTAKQKESNFLPPRFRMTAAHARRLRRVCARCISNFIDLRYPADWMVLYFSALASLRKEQL
jgi:hypothetical protein